MMKLLQPVGFFIASGAVILAVSNILLGRPTTVAQAYGGALAVAVPLVGTGLLCGVLVGIGIVLLIIPGLIIALACAFTTEAVVLERRQFVDAISRSKSLVMGNSQWQRVIILGLVVGVLLLGVGYFATRAVTMFMPGSELGTLLSIVAADLVNAALMPFVLVASLLLYFDIRVRFEGYSLQGLAAELAGQPAPVRMPESWNAASGAPPPWEAQEQQSAPPAWQGQQQAPPAWQGGPQQAWGAPPPQQAWGAPPPPPSPAAPPPQQAWGAPPPPPAPAAPPPQAWSAPSPPQQTWAPPAGNQQWAQQAPPPPPAQGWPTQAPQSAKVCGQCGSPVTTQFCMQCGARQPG